MESGALPPLAIQLVQAITAQSLPPAEMARCIYMCCASCDRSLEQVIASDFETNSNYEDLIKEICSVAAGDPSALGDSLRQLSNVFTAVNATAAHSVTPAKRARSLSPPSEDENASSETTFVIREGSRETRAQAAKRPRLVVNRSKVVEVDPYLDYKAVTGPGGDAHELLKSLRKPMRDELCVLQEGYWDSFRWQADKWRTAPAPKETQRWVSRLKLWNMPFRDGLPNMMTCLLGELEQIDRGLAPRLADFTIPDVNVHVTNASGTGKTRMFFESLTKQWGVYYVCNWDSVQDPHGSRDLHAAIDLIESGNRNAPRGSSFFQYLGKDTAKSDDADTVGIRQVNVSIAKHVFTIVLLARVLVLDIFLDTWQKRAAALRLSDEEMQRSGMKLWARLQIHPTLAGEDDIFHALFTRLLRVNHEQAEDVISQRVRSWNRYSKWFTLGLIIFDEAQAAASRLEYCFPSEASTSSRPVLRPAVITIAEQLSKSANVIIGGTKLGRDMVRNALVTALGKFRGDILEPFQRLSEQSDSQRIQITLRHFFGDVYIDNIPPRLRDDIEFWLAGRHRFLALFIQFTLRGGPGYDVMENVLHNIVAKLTGYRISPNMTDITNMNLAPVLSPDLRYDTEKKGLQDVASNLALIVIRLMIGRGFPELDEKSLDLVTMGVGRLQPVPVEGGCPVVVNEPIILQAVVNWLNKAPPSIHMSSTNLAERLRRALSDRFDDAQGGVKGFAKEDAVIFLLWQAFSGEAKQLSEYFEFPEYIVPPWANQKAQLVRVTSKWSTTGVTEVADNGLVCPLVFQAHTPAETLQWFTRQNRGRYIFLKPDERAGPDAILTFRLESGHELSTLIQIKCWQSEHQKEAHEVEKALFKLSPEGLYHGSLNNPDCAAARNELRQKLGLLYPSGLEMPKRPAGLKANPKYQYDPWPATVPILRVFAAFKGSHEQLDLKQDFGAYPFAYMSDAFMNDATVAFPAFRKAIEFAKTMKPPVKAKSKAA